jgi:F0F1-type ATP synthase assembly protein I
MAKIDEVKEFISYLKVLIVLFLATNISLIGWLVTHYKDSEPIILWLCIIGIVLLFLIIILLNRKIIKDIKSLKDL